MASSKPRKHLSWQDVADLVKDVVDDMVVAGAKPSHILAIGSGGIIPAALISYHFGYRTNRYPSMSVNYAKSYQAEKRGAIVTDVTQNSLNHLPRANGELLIVDDIADTGYTLAHFHEMFPKAKTAVLVHKTMSFIKPDFCGHVDDDGNKWWWVFPWEEDK